MKKVLESMEYVDSEFINEAENYSPKKKNHWWIKYFSAVACLCLIVGLAFAVSKTKSSVNSLSVQAAELGKEEYQFGVALPVILYADDTYVIFYDFRGIYTYSFSKESLEGYVDFRKLKMDRIQGDNPTFVNVSQNGKYVFFYNNSQNYVYDVVKNEYMDASYYEEIEKDIYYISTIGFGEDLSISDGQRTYIGADGSYLAVELDLENLSEDDCPRYKNMYILRKTDDIFQKYYVFE